MVASVCGAHAEPVHFSTCPVLGVAVLTSLKSANTVGGAVEATVIVEPAPVTVVPPDPAIVSVPVSVLMLCSGALAAAAVPKSVTSPEV